VIDLFVLRHGDASFDAPSDDLRELSVRGHKEVMLVYKQILDSLEGLTNIFVSPYVRAQQTADIMCDALDVSFQKQHRLIRSDTALLTPESDRSKLIQFLFDHVQNNVADQRHRILLVSHQPLVSYLLATLCDSVSQLNPNSFVESHRKYSMGTANLAYIKLDVMAAGCGELCWMTKPL